MLISAIHHKNLRILRQSHSQSIGFHSVNENLGFLYYTKSYKCYCISAFFIFISLYFLIWSFKESVGPLTGTSNLSNFWISIELDIYGECETLAIGFLLPDIFLLFVWASSFFKLLPFDTILLCSSLNFLRFSVLLN